MPPYNPPPWYHRDRIVLDLDDNPIECWHEIPLVCSSDMEGWELEAITRTNTAISLSAIRARMPSRIWKGGKMRDLYSLNTLRMRMSRFRLQAGLTAWNEREGTRQMKEEISRILGQECIRKNSTRPFGRDLTAAEMERVKAQNKGTAPQRSRKGRLANHDDEFDEDSDGRAHDRERDGLDSESEEDVSSKNPTNAYSQTSRNSPARFIHSHIASVPGFLSRGNMDHNLKRTRHWVAEIKDEESDNEEPGLPVKRRYVTQSRVRSDQTTMSTRGKSKHVSPLEGHGMPWAHRESYAHAPPPGSQRRDTIDQRRARVQARSLLPAPGYTVRALGRNFASSHSRNQGQRGRLVQSLLDYSEDELKEEMNSVANDVPYQASSTLANIQSVATRPTLQTWTDPILRREPSGNENLVVPSRQTGLHLFKEASFNQVDPSAQDDGGYNPFAVLSASDRVEQLQTATNLGRQISESDQLDSSLTSDMLGEDVDLSAFQVPSDTFLMQGLIGDSVPLDDQSQYQQSQGLDVL